MRLFSSEEHKAMVNTFKAKKPNSNAESSGSAELKSIRSEVDTFISEKKQLQDQISMLKNKQEVLEGKYNTTSSAQEVRFEALETNHKYLQGNITALDVEYNATSSAQKVQLEALETNHKYLQANITVLEGTYNTTSSAQEAQKVQLEALETNHKYLQGNITALDDKYNATSSAQKLQLEALETNHKYLQGNITALDDKYNATSSAQRVEFERLEMDVEEFKMDYNTTVDQIRELYQAQADGKCPNGTLKGEYVLQDIKKIADYKVDVRETKATVQSLSEKYCIPHNVDIFFSADGPYGFYDKELVGCDNVKYVDGGITYILNMTGDQCVMTEAY